MDAYFGGRIPLDPCTDADNCTNAVAFFTEKDDGLIQNWRDASKGEGAYVNPPYGKQLKHWLDKIRLEADLGLPLIVLLPVARTEQRYMTRVLELANVVCWVRKKVNFVDPETGKVASACPFNSVVWGFNLKRELFRNAFFETGMVQAVQLL